MSSESNVGGCNAHNDGQGDVVGEEYGTDNHNSMVEYRLLNSGFDVPDSHEHLVMNRYRGPADDIAYEQLAGQGEIQIIEPNQSVELNGPPEPVVTNSGETRVCIPEQGDPSDIDSVKLGTWQCQKCETEFEIGIENGKTSEPDKCQVCDRPTPFEHVGLDDEEVQAALKASEIWKPASGIIEEGYEQIWADVRSFIYDYWDAEESEIYEGLTAYALSTWLRPNLTFVPHLMLMGKTTGGKTRLLNTLARVSYRAVVAASATPASMFRMIDGYDVSYFVSEYHGLGPDEQRELDNVVRAGQKKGEKITRAEQSTTGFEPRTFDPFSHIAIATQYTPADDIVNRCIQVRSSPSNRDMPATFNEQRAKQIRNRLLYARFRLLDSDEWKAAEQEAYEYLEAKNITGRTREKLLSLVTVAILWDKLDAFDPYVQTICQQDKEAVADSEDARFIEVLRDLVFEQVGDTAYIGEDPYSDVTVPYSEIVEKYEQVNGVEKSPSWVGHIRSRLGFDKKRKSNETVIEDADLRSKLQQHCEEHNLSWQSNDPAEQPDRGHDSGGSTDGTRLKTRLKEHIKKEHPLAEFTPAKVANTFGGDTEQEQIKQALETLAESDGFLERNGGRYNLIGGEL